jgi:hypothetical protein
MSDALRRPSLPMNGSLEEEWESELVCEEGNKNNSAIQSTNGEGVRLQRPTTIRTDQPLTKEVKNLRFQCAKPFKKASKTKVFRP